MSNYQIRISKQHDRFCSWVIRIDNDGEETVVSDIKFYQSQLSAEKAAKKVIDKIINFSLSLKTA